ncbi:MAG: hypothetical protein WD066_03370 [Planctomycetaceae bacterium]
MTLTRTEIPPRADRAAFAPETSRVGKSAAVTACGFAPAGDLAARSDSASPEHDNDAPSNVAATTTRAVARAAHAEIRLGIGRSVVSQFQPLFAELRANLVE